MDPNPDHTQTRKSCNVTISSGGTDQKVNPENTCAHLNMKREEDRLKTFDNWPVSFIDKTAMASTGFYSLKMEDTVKCTFCAVEVGHWEKGDIPMEEHKRWSPLCPFLRGLVGNDDENNECPLKGTRPQAYDVAGIYNIPINHKSGVDNDKHFNENEGEISKQRSGPKYCSYTTINSRMKSFKCWPKSLKPLPEQLSEAGFFYSEKGDYVVCFFCGIGLKDWKPMDDPWVEHCRWSPQCTHVLLNKSKEFRERAVAKEELPVERHDVK